MMTRRHKITVPKAIFVGLKNDGVVVVVVSTGFTRYKDEIPDGGNDETPDDGNDDTPDGGKGSTGAVVSVVAKDEMEEVIKLPLESYKLLVSIIYKQYNLFRQNKRKKFKDKER